MTESAYFASAAQRDSYRELGVDKYEIVATLDSHTSETCRSLDGKVFDMTVYEPGATAPPFHPFCRTATAPWFPDGGDLFEPGGRAARGEDGNTYHVPADMTYAEWEEKFVFGGSAWRDIIGKETAQGVSISALSPHFLKRKGARDVGLDEAIDAIVSPLDVIDKGIGIRGPSSQFIGEYATVVVNPETGVLITTWRTGTKTKEKAKKKAKGKG
jgi:hypothetical protein